MKRKWHHPEQPDSSRQQWRSVGELEGSEEFQSWLEREFPQGAAEWHGDEASRRSFVKLMGASTALAGFGVACSRPVQYLVPYNEHVEWVVPGKALYYSSAKPRLNGLGCDPLVVTTHEGRPTKVDGNRLHPLRSGGSDAYTQASILDLYDPDRSRGFLSEGKPTTRADFEASVLSPLREKKDGGKLAFLLARSTSPTRNRLLKEIEAAYPGVSFYQYAGIDRSGADAAVAELAGEGAVEVPSLEKAKKILSLDCDFLGLEPVGEDSVAEFGKGRQPENEDGMNRLYMVEPAFSLTGGSADHRYRLAPSQVLPVAVLLASEIATATGDAALKGVADSLSGKLRPSVYRLDWIKECAADLVSAKGEALVLAGQRYGREVHLVVAAINKALGAYGTHIKTVRHDLPKMGALADLVSSAEKGEIDTLIVANDGDPVFDAPSDSGFGAALEKIATTVHLGFYQNKTAQGASWHVPGAHYLEAWGDFWSVSGVYSVQQPMINPLWGGVSEISLLLSLLAPAGEGEGEEVESSGVIALDAVKKTFAEVGGKDWNATLRDGFSSGPGLESLSAPDVSGVAASIADAEVVDFPHPEAMEVVLAAGGATYDGRFANNGWLQEAPDPITKLTWDNAVLMSFATAERLGFEDEQLVEIRVGDRKVEAPVLRSPGHADYVVTLALGYYGGEGIGRVSEGAGYDAYPLMDAAHRYSVPGAVLSDVGTSHKLALTAEHYSMEGRAIAREGTLELFEEKPDFAQHQGMDHHIPENVSLYKGYKYNPETEADYEQNESNQKPALEGHAFRIDPHHQWAMTIDLNSCTGCNACVIACQAENNIPIVGKGQVLAGREMHWIRMDRYFTSPTDHKTAAQQGPNSDKVGIPGRRPVDEDTVEMISQPVACVQCESAPCETVCPVNATVHTADGLNAMTYNRCIGTRYCANNCPYKARRFNYYDYNKRPLDQLHLGPLAPAEGNATTSQLLQKNPNVTVRMRGVIEKCTYCVQRINAAKIAAKAAARDSDDIQVPSDSFTVACQDACGAGCIEFGNLRNPDDRVNEAKKNPRNYDLLKYIGTRPRTSYLARVKNPNPKMPGASEVGTVTSRMH